MDKNVVKMFSFSKIFNGFPQVFLVISFPPVFSDVLETCKNGVRELTRYLEEPIWN